MLPARIWCGGPTLKKFKYIDALRGYAILGVLLVHTCQARGIDEAIAFGARGVQLFFVASALTLTMSWHERGDGATAFFVRRLFRIAPMFWLTIVLDVWSGDYPIDWNEIAGAAAFLQGLRPDWINAPIVGGGWSVSAEVMFYVVFPLLMLVITSGPRALALLAAGVWIGGAWATHGMAISASLFPQSGQGEIGVFSFLAFPMHFPAFTAGIFAWFLIPYASRAPRWLLELVLLAGLAYAIRYAMTDVHNIVAFALIFGTIAVCLAAGAGRYLVNDVIAYIGRVSFSAYLLQGHGIALAHSLEVDLGLGGAKSLVVVFPAAALITVALANITYEVIERPCIRLGARLVQWLQRRETETRPAGTVSDTKLTKQVTAGPAQS